MNKRYLVLIEKGKNSYGAYAPDVPGCISTGRTVEETLRNFEEALEFHIESIVRDAEPIPEAVHIEAHFVEVAVPDIGRGKSKNPPSKFARFALEADGFLGFVTIRELRSGKIKEVPPCGGVYIVLHRSDVEPTFLGVSHGGWFKKKDPTVSEAELTSNWVRGADVLYIGKSSSSKGLQQRLRQYINFGSGKAVPHWGGRYIWQLAGSDDFIVAWKCADTLTAEALEASLQDEFYRTYGRLPFANLKKETLI